MFGHEHQAQKDRNGGAHAAALAMVRHTGLSRAVSSTLGNIGPISPAKTPPDTLKDCTKDGDMGTVTAWSASATASSDAPAHA